MGDVTDRISGDLPVTTAKDAASEIESDATLVVSGFGSVGYPKAVPNALANSDRDLMLTVISGGSVGDEIDTDLVEANAISRRFPYQARTASRDAINHGTIAFHDRHVSKTADEVELGYFGAVDTAVMEAVAVGEDWLIPSTSIGHTPGFVRAADRLIVEVNESHPLGLQQLHDVYRPALPPNRRSIPLTSPNERVGSPRVKFDPKKLMAVVRTNQRDSPYEFRDPSDVDEAIASNLAAFLRTECKQNPALTDNIVLQFGVGSLGNALMAAFNSVDFGNRTVSYFGEVIQDGLLDMLDSGNLESASAASLALSAEGQQRLYDHIDRYAEDIILRNADISNNPGLIERFGVIGASVFG
ncbi:acetyl-CoA hydrolase [Haladaptatus sp. NG-WS-4]